MSPNYNPNSIWTSKKEEYKYEPKPKAEPGKKSGTEEKKPAPEEKKPGVDEKKPVFVQKKTPNDAKWGLILFGISLLAVMGGLLFYLLRPNGNANVVLQFTEPAQVLAGDPFTLSISFSNNTQKPLVGANLSLILPKNVYFAGQDQGQRVMERSIGDVTPGNISKQTFTLVTSGDANSVEHLTAQLTYAADANSQTQFENDGATDVTVGESAMTVTFAASQDVFSGQDFPVTVNYNNNTSHELDDVVLQMQYPPAFTFTKGSTPPATPGGASWNIGTLPVGGSGSFTITGNLAGPPGAAYTIAAAATDGTSGATYAIANESANFSIASAPLSLSITANSSPSYISKNGDNIKYAIAFTNNANVAFQDMTVTANLLGGMFDLSSLQTDGSFNSLTDTITWYGASDPQLLSLAPGQSGSVIFNIRTKSAFPIRLISDKNYTLAVNVKIASPTVPPDTAASSTVSVMGLTTKVGGEITLGGPAYWHEPSAPILNTGPYPPKVNQTTDYTVHWDVTDYATDADNVTVSAYLAAGVACTGKTEVPASTTLTCNPASGQVTWTIPVVPATTGVISKPLEAVFQIENTPAVNQVGNSIPLIGAASLTATDGFTGSTMQASAPAVTTALPDDRSITTTNRGVTQ